MILAILQARTTSTRLPGKILKPLLGKPMLSRQIERIKRSKRIDQLIVATSLESSDDDVEKLALQENVMVYRGSLNDVLDRFYQAALKFNPQYVVRLTGDCPLIDPVIIDDLIEFHIKGGFDYSSNAYQPTFPDGLDTEVFQFSLLKEAWEKSILPRDREHVTQYFYNKGEQFKIGNFQNNIDYSHLRWTVDEPKDFELVSKIYEALYSENPTFGFYNILEFLKKNPELETLNTQHKRNEGLKEEMIAIRVDASVEIGLGHLARCLNLADALKTRGGNVVFIIKNDSTALKLISARGFNCQTIDPKNSDEDAQQTIAVLEKLGKDINVLIDHYGINFKWEQKIRKYVKRIAVLDDLADRKHDCDCLIDGAVDHDLKRYDVLVPAGCKKMLGGEYAILNSQFASVRKQMLNGLRNRNRVHVFFGGADQNNWTEHFSRLLIANFSELHLVIVTGPFYKFDTSIEKLCTDYPGRITWMKNIQTMAESMLDCGIGVGAPGTTTWERACMGLPSAYLAIAENQIPILEKLHESGFCVYLGNTAEIKDSDFLAKFGEFRRNNVLLEKIYQGNIRSIDGCGASRIANELFSPVTIGCEYAK